MKKPNTKNVLMILIAVLLVGGAFLVAEYRNKQVELINNANSIIVVSTTTDINFIDNNEDWKKILLATDKSSSSTLIKDLTKNEAELTATDLMARDFFARYIALNHLGASKDPESQANLIKETLANITLEQPRLYTTNDGIVTKADISLNSIKQYGNDIGTIFRKNRTNSRNEAIIAKDALTKEDTSMLKELDPIIASYQNMLNSLIKTVVPQSMLNAHLGLINAMSSALFIVNKFKMAGSDPLSGVQAVSQYQPTFNKMHDALASIRGIIVNQGIVYTKNDDGYIFTK